MPFHGLTFYWTDCSLSRPRLMSLERRQTRPADVKCKVSATKQALSIGGGRECPQRPVEIAPVVGAKVLDSGANNSGVEWTTTEKMTQFRPGKQKCTKPECAARNVAAALKLCPTWPSLASKWSNFSFGTRLFFRSVADALDFTWSHGTEPRLRPAMRPPSDKKRAEEGRMAARY